MAILVLSHPLPAQPFAQALRALAGDTPVWTEDDVCDPRRVEALLAWQLKPGILPRYPGLRVLRSTGAGVDKLIRRLRGMERAGLSVTIAHCTACGAFEVAPATTSPRFAAMDCTRVAK
jgi:hypothetical protein